jgi:hypothetical protein
VKIPVPLYESGPKLPVPPTMLELKANWPIAGSPPGFMFPNASFMVIVATTEEPETTVFAEVVITLWANE